MRSVMANPENQGLRRQQERQRFLSNPLGHTGMEQEVGGSRLKSRSRSD